jgi:quinol monooxygenase YgiN
MLPLRGARPLRRALQVTTSMVPHLRGITRAVQAREVLEGEEENSGDVYARMVAFRVKADQADAFRRLSTYDAQSSVVEEKGCYRFDIVEHVPSYIPDAEKEEDSGPALFGFVQLYSSEEAFNAHKATAHSEKWHRLAKGMLEDSDNAVTVTACKNVFPRVQSGPPRWRSLTGTSSQDPFFAEGNGSLCVVMAPQFVKVSQLIPNPDHPSPYVRDFFATFEPTASLCFCRLRTLRPSRLPLYETPWGP